MQVSRLRRFEEKRLRKRIVLTIGASIGLLLFVLFFGMKMLINFSVLVDKAHGTTQQTTSPEDNILFPPILDPLPEATNAAQLTVTGRAKPNMTVILYLNDTEVNKTTASVDGSFMIRSVSVKEGNNQFNAKIIDANANSSDLSKYITVTIKKKAPSMEVNTPTEGTKVQGDTAFITVAGRVEADTDVTINNRFVIIKNDNTFSYQYPLVEGENVLKIIANDQASNQTTIERKVYYQK